MIFTTVEDSLNSANTRLAIFGKSIRDIITDVKNTHKLTFKGVLRDEDVRNLTLYSEYLKVTGKEQQGFDRYLSKSSSTAQALSTQIKALYGQYKSGKISLLEYRSQVKSLVVEEQMATASTNILKVAVNALKVALDFGLSLILSGLITAWQNHTQAQEEAIENTRQAAETFQEASKSIDEYCNRIKTLRNEYDNENTSTERNKQIREELKQIQDEIIKNYGIETDQIDILTGNVDKYTEALKRNNRARYNEDVYKKNPEQIENAIKNVSKVNLVLDSSRSFSGKNDLDGILYQFFKDAGYKQANYLGSGLSWQMYGDVFSLDKVLSDAQDKIQEMLDSDDVSNWYKEKYQEAYNYIASVRSTFIDKIKEDETTFAQWLINRSDFGEKYDELVAAQADYEYAKETGTQQEILDATEKFNQKRLEILNSIDISQNGGNAALGYLSQQFTEASVESTNATKTIVDNSKAISNKLSDLNSSLDGVYDSFDTAFSNQSTIQSTFDKIQSGTDLTTSEMKSLIKLCKNDFPEIGTLFTKTAKGWTISSDDLIRANNALMKSTKETVQQQIDGYNEVIRTYENRFVTIPKGGQTIQVETDVGISEEEYKNATEQVENLKKVLETLGLVVDSDTDNMEQFTKTLKTLSTNISTGVSAQKEMNENGKISASTLESLLSLGDDYIKCITVENGIIKFNADIFKEVTKAKLDDEIATLKLAQAEAIHARIEDAQYNKGKEGAKLQAIIDETNLKLKAAQALRDGLDETWDNELKDNSGSSSDPTKDAYTEKQKELKHLLEMEKITQKQYYEMLFGSDEYKALLANRTKYRDELNSIDEEYYKYQQNLYKENADKQFDDLEDQYKRGIITAEQYAQGLYDLGQELYGEGSIYGGTEFAIKALEELDKKVKETSEDIYDESLDSLKKSNNGTLKSEEQFIKDWTKLNDDTWKTINPKQWEENYNEIADYTQDFYKDLLDKGLLNPDQYKDKVQDFFYRLRSMGIDLGKNWLADALEIDDIEYDKLKENLSADGDRTLDDVLADAEKLSEKNIKLFSDDPETLRKNAEDIFKSVSESAKDALDKMLITPDEYLQIIDKWGDNLNISKGLLEEAKELSEDDYLDRWDLDNGYDENKSKDNYDLRAKRIEYIYELAEKLYGKNGQKNLKAYNTLINQGLEDVESLVEDYYDEEIKKLEKINDEEEKRQKALELQLNLIKARQKLEEAKSQRNQLILENGVFRYDYDQEAVMSAQEDIAEAEKAILEQEREDQKEALENQKEETLKFFNSVGGKLDDFIDRVEKFLAGDKDAFKVNESKTDVKTDVEVENDNNSSDIKDKNIVSKITDISDVTKDTFNIAKTLADNFSFENLVRALGGNPTAEAVKNFKDSYNATLVGKQITPSTLPSNVTNNSSTTNNSAKTVNIGDIHLHLDLTVESLEDFVENKLEQFAQEVGDAFETEILRKMTSN